MDKNNMKRLPDQVSLCSTRPAKTNAVGRSMVEMLGVLAIIGVLSAGALAGYSKAMFRHKMNQTIDIFSQVLQRFAELEQKNLGDNFKMETADDIVKYGLMERCQKQGDDLCKLPLGYLLVNIENGSKLIRVDFTSSKECVAFASMHWENAVPIEWHQNMIIDIQGDGNHEIFVPANNVNETDIKGVTEACEDQCANLDCSFMLMIN